MTMSNGNDLPRLTGDERLKSRDELNRELAHGTVLDFWSWSSSNLLDNTLRGTFGEYLVALAIGDGDAFALRTEPWANWDLQTEDGIKIEVKTTGLRQTWHADESQEVSTPRWDIAEKRMDAQGKGYVGEPKRWAKVYVFALHKGRNLDICSVIDVAQWVFWVVATKNLPGQKSIGKSTLKKIQGAKEVDFKKLKAAFDSVSREI